MKLWWDSFWEFLWDVLMEPRKGSLIPRDPDPLPVRERVEVNDLANLNGCPCGCCNGGSLSDPNYRPGRGTE